MFASIFSRKTLALACVLAALPSSHALPMPLPSPSPSPPGLSHPDPNPDLLYPYPYPRRPEIKKPKAAAGHDQGMRPGDAAFAFPAHRLVLFLFSFQPAVTGLS